MASLFFTSFKTDKFIFLWVSSKCLKICFSEWFLAMLRTWSIIGSVDLEAKSLSFDFGEGMRKYALRAAFATFLAPWTLIFFMSETILSNFLFELIIKIRKIDIKI